MLTSCGFQLRGNVDFPPALARVAITATDLALSAQLSDALQQNGALVVTRHPTAIIDISLSRFARTTLTTDASGRASAYTLQYEVLFTVRNAADEELQAAHPISLQRAYEYQPHQQLQVETEVDFLKSDMRRAAVARIVQQLVHL